MESTTRKTNTNIKQEVWTMVAVQGADSGGRRGRRTRRRRGLDPEQNGIWKDWKKEGVMECVSAPGWKDRRRKKNWLYCTQYRGVVGTEMMSCCADMMSCCADMMSCCADMMSCCADVMSCCANLMSFCADVMSCCAAMMSFCSETIATRSRLCR
jgi:hypothetical protein